jgi:hypothetical protein
VIAEAVLALALDALNQNDGARWENRHGPKNETWSYEFTDIIERGKGVVVVFNVWEDRPVLQPSFEWMNRECELDGIGDEDLVDGESLQPRFETALENCLYEYESGKRPIARPGDWMGK